MSAIATVSTCAATACAYNDNNSCHAFAVTVGEGSACRTRTTLDIRAIDNDQQGKVGACHRLDCVHNENLQCSATSIEMVEDTANCGTYQAR